MQVQYTVFSVQPEHALLDLLGSYSQRTLGLKVAVEFRKEKFLKVMSVVTLGLLRVIHFILH